MRLLEAFHSRARGRTFFFTEEGYIGLAPKAAQRNDVVVLVLGCQAPMILHPRHDKQYIVVGECYVHGMMTGEILLGPLPTGWQLVHRTDEQSQEKSDGFINREKGIWQIKDPRLGPLPDDWVMENRDRQHIFECFRNESTGSVTSLDPRMSTEALHARGVNLKAFDLI